ncbi:MAG: Wzz/FepE/Etk N-terminal domain-containing protein [Bacteroidota bacterium]|nr:Wzz/FepE/Etk N-terminal domain-containing protein [Bacteroidota bacterium]
MDSAEDNKNSVKELIHKIGYLKKILLKHWLIIFSVSIIFASLGLLYSIYSKPTYIATISFSLEDQDEMGGMAGLASQFGINIGGGSNEGLFSNSENIIALFETRQIIKKVLFTEEKINNRKQLLINHYLDFNEYLDKWKKDKVLKNFDYFKSENVPLTRLQDSVISGFYQEIVENNLDVSKPNKKANIITVTLKSKDELFSKLFAENLTEVVSDYFSEYKTKKARENVKIIQNRSDSVKRALSASEYELAVFKDRNQNLIKAESYLSQVRLARDVEILNIMNTEIIKNLELAKMALLNKKPLIQIIDYPVLPLERKKLRKKHGILIFGALGFFMISGYIIGKDLLKKTLQS